jgi:hypothetical protein
MMEKYEVLSKRMIVSDEATLHLSGNVNRPNIRLWGCEKPVAVTEMGRDSAHVNLFCAVSKVACSVRFSTYANLPLMTDTSSVAKLFIPPPE